MDAHQASEQTLKAVLDAFKPTTLADPDGQVRLEAFRQGLHKLGWNDHTLHIDYRFAETDLDHMRLNVVEMVRLAPDVIVAANTQTVQSLQRATRTVPIVFVEVSDPVRRSFVESLANPGGRPPPLSSARRAKYISRVPLFPPHVGCYFALKG